MTMTYIALSLTMLILARTMYSISLLKTAPNIFSLGCQLHHELYTIYSKQNTLIDRIFAICVWSMWFIVISEHIVPALGPILYYFFGFPTSEYWVLVLDLKDV